MPNRASVCAAVTVLAGRVDADQPAWNSSLLEISSMVIGKKAMSALDARIWVVITDGVNTRLCSSEDGRTTPIAPPAFPPETTDSPDRYVSMHTAWFKAEGQRRLSRSDHRQHLWHVSQLLLEGAREGAYDGLIIIAAADIAAKLKETLAPETRALLIGKVVRDSANFETPMHCGPAEIRH